MFFFFNLGRVKPGAHIHADVSEYGNIDQATTKSNITVNGRCREMRLREVTLHLRRDFSFVHGMLYSTER